MFTRLFNPLVQYRREIYPCRKYYVKCQSLQGVQGVPIYCQQTVSQRHMVLFIPDPRRVTCH